MSHLPVAFRVPPGWPDPPPGWLPPHDWAPPPDWPPAPDGWEFFLELPSRQECYRTCRVSHSPQARRAYASTSPPRRASHLATPVTLIAALLTTLWLLGAITSNQSTPESRAAQACTATVDDRIPSVPPQASTTSSRTSRATTTRVDSITTLTGGEMQVRGTHVRNGESWSFTCTVDLAAKVPVSAVEVVPSDDQSTSAMR